MPVAPPQPRALPLNALRAFEAAARLESFVAAAEELGVTPGAVAAHVKALEAEIGATLFQRQARGIRLTLLGRRALPDFVAAFDGLALATTALRGEAAPQRVHIAALPAIAQLWLSPRLPALRRMAPDIAVSITVFEEPPNLKRSVFDLSIFYRAEGDGLALDDDIIFPACAPSLAQALRTPDDLRQVTCLTDAVWAEDWSSWMNEVLPGMGFVPRGPVFSLYALAVAEAVNGAGVVIAHEALVRDELRTGKLVAPFVQRVRLPRALSVASPGPSRRGSGAEKVTALLREQAYLPPPW